MTIKQTLHTIALLCTVLQMSRAEDVWDGTATRPAYVLFMGGNNTLYYPMSGAGIGAMRAYIRIGDDATANVRRIGAFNINFGDGEETAIGDILDDESANSASAWYDLSGRKLDAAPTREGVYIHDGQKVVVK